MAYVPRTTRKRRNYRRRPTNARYRRKRAARPATTVIRASSAIPDRIVAKFPYADTYSMTSSTLTSVQSWRNSMFDPDYSGSGHQPFMRDQISAWYNKYICYGFKYDIFIHNTSASDTMRYCITPFNHTGSTDMNTIWEKPHSRFGTLTPDTGSRSSVRLRGYMSAPKALQVTKKQFVAEKNYWGATGGNPTQEAYLSLFTQAANGLSSVTARITVRLEFFTMWFERDAISGS